MENLVKTTNLRFKTSKDGVSADIYAVKDTEGNVINLTLNSITKNDRHLGDLYLTVDASTEIAGIAALVEQALGEAAAEGEVVSNEVEE